MWKRKEILSLLATLFAAGLLLPAVPAGAVEVSGQLQGSVRWEGEVTLKSAVIVARDAVLTVAAGTVVKPLVPAAKIVVQGMLLARGTEAAPIVFASPPQWQGIEFVEGPAGSAIEYARFEKAQAALSSIATPFSLRASSFRECGTAVKLLREAAPVIEECLFVDNDIAIDNEMKSAPVIRNNRFAGHKKTAILASHNSTGLIEKNVFEKNKQGIGLLQKYPDRVIDNRFVDNEAGIFCNQTQNTPQIHGNTFVGNENALINFSFSYPSVENNTFIDNDTAIRNDQFGSPLVVHNLFRGNKTALYNNRKSNPKIEKNLIEKNDLALFCDYSSYPRVKENNFLGNRMGVELGIYQSADWEKRSGSKAIVQQEAAARKSQNPLLSQAPTEFSDFVDVSGNWWGNDTARLESAGADGNVTIFFDRHDKPEVTYEGFGPDSYVLDRVTFIPWLPAPVADAGLTEEK
jgi:nitrous oxidase accessory protein NosD